MTEVIIDGKKVRLSPSQEVGHGGEADIYKIAPNTVLKLYKGPDHSDFLALPDSQRPIEQKLAIHRLAEQQTKLLAMPKNMPSNVVTPQALAFDSKNQIVGYTMPFVSGAEVLLKYSEPKFRQQGIDPNDVIELIRRIHATIIGIHQKGVIIGDNNGLNILVKGTEPSFIDTDSYQFGSFLCRVYTQRFIDPLLCDSKAKELMMKKQFTTDSDWYAFAVMLMQSLLYVGPYGGIFRPANKKDLVLEHLRLFKRITVFNPEVRYPKPALPFSNLPDELVDYLKQVFEKDVREIFPQKLLTNLRWTTCSICGLVHARPVCPICAPLVAPQAVVAKIQVRGNVTANKVFKTKGVILRTSYQHGRLKWLYHEGNSFKRENGSAILSGALDKSMRFRLMNDTTIIAAGERLITISEEGKIDQQAVELFGNLPVYDSNENHYYWLKGGSLYKNGEWGPEQIGTTLSGQSIFWVGPTFGFGFWRAGGLSSSYIFDTVSRGINDAIKIPIPTGQLIDATAIFTSHLCHFFTSAQEKGKIINRCTTIDANGNVLATAQAEQNDASWLGTIRGHTAAGGLIFSPTDDGVARIEINSGQLVETKRFPDTEPFVSRGDNLIAVSDGLFVIDAHEIVHIKIS